MKVGIIGEKNNPISYAIFRETLSCRDIAVEWFIEAKLPNNKREQLYGETFDYGPIIRGLRKISSFLNSNKSREHIDCERLSSSKNVPYIVPKDLSINTGLPKEMYLDPKVDYAIIAGCDQILDKEGLKIAKSKVINYHYSPLPAYRGKFVLFWQWYNREPYIGYSFHEVSLGMDTGKIIYQDKVDYDHDEPLNVVRERVVSVSAKRICRLYECLVSDTRALLDGNLQDSFYPSKKCFELTTADRSKSVDELLELFRRAGHFRLKNGLSISKIVHSSKKCVADYGIDNEGIVIPLRDGHIKGAFSSRVPFWISKILIGKKNILRGLN